VDKVDVMIDVSSPNKLLRLSFVTCVSNDEVYRSNFLASACLGPDPGRERIAVTNCPSAGDGLNAGLESATSHWVVCVHQDVILNDGWEIQVSRQLCEAERQFGPIGVAGVYGVGDVIEPSDPTQPPGAPRVGWVIDRGRELHDGPGLPAKVTTLDELLLIVRRDSGLRFDPALGFHLYGADICLQARERGLAVVALGALCHHNSSSVGLPEAFFHSARVFARKWSHRLPVATACVIIDRRGSVHLLGNATPGPGSIAYILERATRRDDATKTTLVTPNRHGPPLRS
jgi:hypothetical protein